MKPGRVYRLLERLELFLYRRSCRVISLTHSFVDDLTRRGVPSEKIDVVLGGANLHLFSPRPRDKEIERKYGLEGRFVVGYLGTLGLSHGLENVLKAAELMKDDAITFFFVGAGAARNGLRRLAGERHIRSVVFAPRQLKEDMPRFWSVCSVSLIHLRNAPVFTTVIPSKIFESMAMGLPIVYVGPSGEGSSIVERYHAGLVVPPEDPRALVDAVRTLARDRKLYLTLSSHGLHAAPRFSRDRHARETLAVLEKAAKLGA